AEVCEAQSAVGPVAHLDHAEKVHWPNRVPETEGHQVMVQVALVAGLTARFGQDGQDRSLDDATLARPLLELHEEQFPIFVSTTRPRPVRVRPASFANSLSVVICGTSASLRGCLSQCHHPNSPTSCRTIPGGRQPAWVSGRFVAPISRKRGSGRKWSRMRAGASGIA